MFELIRSDIARMRELCGVPSARVSGFSVLLGVFNPRLCPVILIRAAAWLTAHRLGPLGKLITIANLVIFGIEVSARIPVGPGLFLPHTSGTVIGAASVGANVTIFQGVTLGAKELDMAFDTGSRPVIEDGVVVGAGAKVLGGIRIGAGARIGANAVVVSNVPAGAVAVGIPARIVEAEAVG